MLSHLRSRSATAAFAIAAVALLAACDGGGAGEPTAGPTAAAATATPVAPARGANELGTAPIFYGPLDADFASIRAGEPYKVLFRITGGYAEETLLIEAEHADSGERATFEALLAEPTGEEERPGTFYPVNLDLPEPGTWRLTVVAGEDTASFSIEVGAPEAVAPDRY